MRNLQASQKQMQCKPHSAMRLATVISVTSLELTVILFNTNTGDEGIIKKIDSNIVRIINKEQL